MPDVINRRDLDFILYEVLNIESLCQREYFGDHGRDTFDPLIDTAHSIAVDHFLACAASGDADMARVVDGKVHMIPEAKTALDNFYEAGFAASVFDYKRGGAQLPVTVANACMFIFYAANIGLAGLPLLTVGVANLVNAYSREEHKALYLPGLLTGRFYGTMCLSEPQSGSSLTDIRTTAEAHDDGSYLIKGNKMWITGGEHELSENILHMVLAKIPGGPAGVKGISLFIVPRYLVNEDGGIGAYNNVTLAGLNHKMGQRVTPNALINLGENGDTIGYLVGEPHRGLEYMFHMMNEARIGVGVSATGAGYAGYLYSLEYARGRTQGRLPENKDPSSDPVPIIQHADVKRMLLAQKAYVEGALALCLYASSLVDDTNHQSDETVRQDSWLLLEFLTPIVKAWPSEWCLEANKQAIQVLGGYGYTQDYPVERLYRDNRLNMIHEGANGIHGIDLLGRKVLMKGGAGYELLMARTEDTLVQASAYAKLQEFVDSLRQACVKVRDATEILTKAAADGKTAVFIANSSVYLDMLSHVVIAWLWLKQAVAAQQGLPGAHGPDQQFYAGKMQACRYYFRWELPKTYAQAELLSSLDTTCLDMAEDTF